MTVSGVLQHIWHNEGVPGLFRCLRPGVNLQAALGCRQQCCTQQGLLTSVLVLLQRQHRQCAAHRAIRSYPLW